MNPIFENIITELIQETAYATNHLEADYINELENKILIIKSIYPENSDIKTMIGWIAEARRYIKQLMNADWIDGEIIINA